MNNNHRIMNIKSQKLRNGYLLLRLFFKVSAFAADCENLRRAEVFSSDSDESALSDSEFLG